MNIRPLTLQDEHEWASLLAICFDRAPEQARQILGWFQSMDTLIAWGAWDHEHLAAQYACLMRDVVVPGYGTVRVGMSLNMAVHPDYRGCGLIKQVAAPVYDAVRACGGIAGVGFSNAEGVQVDRRSKGYGYQVIGRMQSLLALVPPQSANRVTDEDLHNHTDLQYPHIHFDAPAHLLQKRFLTHPFRRYHYHCWTIDDLLKGAVVYRPVQQAGLQGVSLLAASGDNLMLLLRYWLIHLRQRHYHFIHLLASPHASYKRALAHMTPLVPMPYSRSPFYLTTKPLCADLPPSWFDFAAWDCIGGDIL